ncbi:MAG: hypothetical protein PUB21_07935 [Bacteroidales bacterium]|nr:hypothetical protein [Bacteroidales bacterium]
MKNIIYILLALLIIFSCSKDNEPEKLSLVGKTFVTPMKVYIENLYVYNQYTVWKFINDSVLENSLRKDDINGEVVIPNPDTIYILDYPKLYIKRSLNVDTYDTLTFLDTNTLYIYGTYLYNIANGIKETMYIDINY